MTGASNHADEYTEVPKQMPRHAVELLDRWNVYGDLENFMEGLTLGMPPDGFLVNRDSFASQQY